MPAAGFTLIEMLIAITIIGVLSVTSFVYSRSLSQERFLAKALDSTQSLLRSAQSNATTGFNCGSTAGASGWSVQFKNDDKAKINLNCDKSANPIRTLSLENNIQVDSITGSSCMSAPPFSQPVNVSFSSLYGKVTFSGSDSCIAQSSTLTITLKNISTAVTKTFTISRGGAINVQ